MKLFERIGFEFFYWALPFLKDNFEYLKEPLRILREKRSLSEYLANSLGFSFFLFSFFLSFFSVFLTITTRDIFFSLFFSLTFSLFLSIVTFLVLVYFPILKISFLSKKIDKELPLSILSLSTFISDEILLENSFELFAKTNRKRFKLAKEIGEIVEHVKYLGKDIFSALEYKITFCPSKKLRDILWGIYSTLKSGGSVAEYIRNKANELMNEYRREIREFSRKVVLFIEIYLLLIILGSLFFVILTSIFSALSQREGTVFFQFFLSSFSLPLTTVFVILLMRSIVPYEV